MANTPEPRTSENVPPHLIAEADQLQAGAQEFAEADEILIEQAQALPDSGEDFWASARRKP